MLETPGLPLFLQFKVSDYMSRANAREARQRRFSLPFFRMKIRASRYSDQHRLLIELERTRQWVFYVASAFSNIAELNRHYQNRQIRSNSLWLRPEQIGVFNDDREHYVAFQLPDNWMIRSNPIEGKGLINFTNASRQIATRIKEEGERLLSRESIEELSQRMFEIAQLKRDIPPIETDLTKEILRTRHPLFKISFYASFYMGASFFIARAA